MALVSWIVLAIGGGQRHRVTLITLLLCALVLAERLAPFQFTVHGRDFGWIPFHSFIYGSIEVNIMSFFEKAFLYGSLIWLMGKAGLRLGISIGVVTLMLFVTSWVETYLAGRSAEITDAMMALVMGAVIALMGTETRTTTSLGIDAGLR